MTEQVSISRQQEIALLKKEKDAVILAHYYVDADVQKVADYVGDSYYLGRLAVDLPQKTVVLCGVSFMGESAKLLNPQKTVFMPDLMADCPMAHMVTKKMIDEARSQYPDLAVVCYINSTAKIKSWSDVCVTSANAVKIVRQLPQKYILFIPDQNLGHYVAEQIPEKHFLYQNGYCPIHQNMTAKAIAEQKRKHPDAHVICHPECVKAVLDLADHIGSTSELVKYVSQHPAREYIVGTEQGVLAALEAAQEDAVFYFPEPDPVCEGMKKNTLDKIIDVLKNGTNEVNMPKEEYVKAAGSALKRMMELSQKKAVEI